MPNSPQIDAAAVKQVMDTMLAKARASDHASAVMTAMLSHLYPELAQGMGISTLYQWLLDQGLQSNDPELLACLAEQLLMGKCLAGDGKMAHRAIKKADEISGFMGSYIFGRMTSAHKPEFAIKQYRKARKAGHIPSMRLEHILISKRIPLFGTFIRLLWFNVMDYICATKAVYVKDKRRLWRGLDVFGDKKSFLEFIGSDRIDPFSRIDAFVPVTASHSNVPGTRNYKQH